MFFDAPFKVLHLSLSSDGLGHWNCLGPFWFRVLGNLCAKPARNAARFSLSCFCWLSGLLFAVFRRVLLVLGFCSDKFLFYKFLLP